MNKLLGKLCAFLSITVAAGSLMSSAISAPLGLSKPHSWTIDLKTKRMPLHFEYQGSTLKPVIKAELKVYEGTDEEHKELYEYLWYGNGKSIGLERKAKLKITPGDAIAIVVKHGESPDYEERRAAAKAVMSAVLDAQLNHNMVATIKVPASSFDTICSEIGHYNFHPLGETPDEEIHSDLSLFVEADSGDEKKTLYHMN